jgi:hypothetical protein
MKTMALTMLCVLAAAPPDARAEPPSADAVDRLTLPEGRFVIDAFLEMNLGSDEVFKPFSITPDLWYGVTDALTLGLVHSFDGATGFVGGVGDSLCLTGRDNGCPHVYDNVGVDVRYRLMEGGFALAADGGLFFRSFDPVQLALKLGVAGRWHKDQLAVELEPALFFGLTNRSRDVSVGLTTVSVTTNGDSLSVPVTGLYSVTPGVALAVQLGLILPFQDTGDTYSIPLSIGVHLRATEKLNLFAAFSLTRLIGGGDAGAFDNRSVTIGGSYAL